MTKNHSIVAREFGVYPSVKLSEEEALNLIKVSIKKRGITEKQFLTLNRPAKKLVIEHTTKFPANYITSNKRLKEIISNGGECFETSYQKMNHGCVGCYYKKPCKKATALREDCSDPEDDVVQHDQMKLEVDYVSISKVHRALTKKGIDLGKNIELEDNSGRKRSLSEKALEITYSLKVQFNEQIDKSSTFVQIYRTMKKHNLFEGQI